ncbi:MAG: molecular chaperone HtpG [Brevinematales bacterium]|nr:molecular chaperone HtpG [Brevinematales bacterium]
MSERFSFQAETKRLLDLVIHSIYTNKEIFLRELISNASDAIDKLRLLSLTDSKLTFQNGEIWILADKDKRTLSIIDNGIGMNKDDLINHIGTIAKSGTSEFLAKISENKANNIAELIGQFGVGFYSAFMVSDKVEVITKKAGENVAYKWESYGEGEYTISEVEKENNGTEVKLYLKPVDEENGIEDYTDEWVISKIVKKYSDFIQYPIKTYVEDKEKKTKEEKILNSMKPIWRKSSSEIGSQELEEFYKHISHDWNKPLKHILYKAEGTLEFYSLLFIPSKAPFDFYFQGYKGGLSLYVKKVLIAESYEDLLPKYLRFVKGVVESSDLSLNISRETLQNDRIIVQIRKNLTKKVLDSLFELLEQDRENYLNFWKEFGNALKEGIISDVDNRNKLISLLLFESTNSDSKLTTFKEYLGRMKEDQKEIYFIASESRVIAENSPHLELLKQKGYEVIFLLNPIDEVMIQYIPEFEGKKIKVIGRGKLDIESEDFKERKKEVEKKSKEMKDFLSFISKELENQIKEARFSENLISAPCCLVGEEYDISPSLEKYLKKENPLFTSSKRILELNPFHPVIQKMYEKYRSNSSEESLKDYCELLLDYSLLSEGQPVNDPVKFNKIFANLMEKGL